MSTTIIITMSTGTRTGSSIARLFARARAFKAVSLSLAVLGLAAGVQVAIFVLSGSVALLADLIHKLR